MNDNDGFGGVRLYQDPLTVFLAEDGQAVTQLHREDADPDAIGAAWDGLAPELERCGLPHGASLVVVDDGSDDGWSFTTFAVVDE